MDVAFSGDGRTLAANDRADRPTPCVTLWDTATWKVRRTVDGPAPGTPAWFTLAPDGNHVAGTVEGRLRLWDVPAGNSTLIPMEVPGTPRLTFSPDGKLLAIGPDREPYAVTLLDIASGRTVAVLPIPGSGDVLAFSPDGHTLACDYRIPDPGSGELQKNFVRLWDVPNRRQRLDLDYGDTGVGEVAFSPDSKLLATTDYVVRVWDLAADPPRVLWQQEEQYPQGLNFSPDGPVLLVGNNLGEVKFLEATTGKELHTLKVQSRTFMALALSPDGRLLAVASELPSVAVWDVSGIVGQMPGKK
jgi:WD40 repeat protein